jgi:hypothetical protein
MKDELRKSLTDLIDETLLELEELKKSRYSAAETEIKGPGEGIAGKPSNGDLHAKAEDDKKKKEDEEDEEAEEAKKAEGKNEEAAKAEGKNEEAAKAEKDEPKDKDKKKDDKEPHKDDPKHEEKEKEMGKKLLDMHKAQEEFPSLMKSFVEERVKPLEDKLSTILELVNKIAEQPVAPKGVTANAVPLRKSAEDGAEQLSKSEVASKLFELKKSGTKVDSLDITRAEMGHDLQKIVDKYKIS